MTRITESNKQALREFWQETKEVVSDPLLWAMAAVVAFLFMIPWLMDTMEAAIWK